MKLTITITVTNEPEVSCQTSAGDMTREQVRPALERAKEALQAEIDALDTCPWHNEASAS